MPTRREFLRHVSSAGLLIGSTTTLPSILVRAAEATNTDNVLVVVFLRGGNDGLNTVIRFRDPNYTRYRPQLRIDASSALPITDSLALHPSLRGLADLWEDGRLTIVQGVGYPNHLRSHFESTAVWHAARLSAKPHAGDGWLGRALDGRQTMSDPPLAVAAGILEAPEPLRGRVLRTSSPADCSRKEAILVARLLRASEPSLVSDHGARTAVAMMRRDVARSLERWSSEPIENADTRANSVFAQHLKQAGRLIADGNPARVYYIEHAVVQGNGGYDTHAAQREPHAALLRDLGGGLSAFIRQLRGSGDADRVTVMVFSEFGRRVAENGSGGTDHGAAGPVFLLRRAGGGGLYGQQPDLERLDDGSLAVTTDFRSVYATLLRSVLEIDPGPILDADFPLLPG